MAVLLFPHATSATGDLVAEPALTEPDEGTS
jgi:hypothetical protein